MREMTIQTWCDNASRHNDERVPAQPHTVQLDGSKLVDLDLCTVCTDDLLRPLAMVAESFGHPPETAPAARKTTKTAAPADDLNLRRCMVCTATPITAQALSQHYVTHHAPVGTTFGAACPLCDFESTTATGLGAHVSLRHDVPNLACAWSWAEATGDPVARVKAWRASNGPRVAYDPSRATTLAERTQQRRSQQHSQ